jgi:hypothetical protein
MVRRVPFFPNPVQADIVAEISAIAAADVVYDYLALLSMGVDSGDAKAESQRDEL